MIHKLVLESEDEILNKIDTTSVTDKNATCKNNYLIYIILLIIMSLVLLTNVSVMFCYYYTRYWLKR